MHVGGQRSTLGVNGVRDLCFFHLSPTCESHARWWATEYVGGQRSTGLVFFFHLSPTRETYARWWATEYVGGQRSTGLVIYFTSLQHVQDMHVGGQRNTVFGFELQKSGHRPVRMRANVIGFVGGVARVPDVRTPRIIHRRFARPLRANPSDL